MDYFCGEDFISNVADVGDFFLQLIRVKFKSLLFLSSFLVAFIRLQLTTHLFGLFASKCPKDLLSVDPFNAF